MQTYHLPMTLIASMFFLSASSINALTLTVTSPLDNGAGTLLTLREAIDELNLNGDPAGNMILFDLPGPDTTINLISPLPAITKQVTIDGLDQTSGNRVTIDGISTPVGILAGLHFTTNAASNSTVTNLIIQNFANTMANGSAYGILFNNNANNSSVINCLINVINSGPKSSAVTTDAEAMGIRSFNSMNTITSNEVSFVVSDTSGINTGNTAGVYVENSITGSCSDNLINVIISGDAGLSSGFAYGIFANILAICSNNIIATITSGSGFSLSGAASGIIIQNTSTQECTANIIALITSGTSAGLSSGLATGVTIGIGSNINDNIVSQVTSGDAIAAPTSGNAYGISIMEAHNVNRNSIASVISGDNPTRSGDVSGIILERLTSICNENLINIITAGTAPALGSAQGLYIATTTTGVAISNNTISNITGAGGISSSDLPTAGLYLIESSRPSLENNTITSVIGAAGALHGMLLGCASQCGSGPLPSVTNGTIFSNTISAINGTASNGFGISLLEGSTGNDILYTLIFNINGKALNIVDNGAPVDGVIQLDNIECCTRCAQENTFVICGTLEPAVNFLTKQFLIQLFVSTVDQPPQIETFIGEFTIQAFGNPTIFCEEFLPLVPLEEGQFITATATAITPINNNTSEVSNPITVPECMPPNICEIITRPPLDPPDLATLCGFISVNRNESLSTNDAVSENSK